MKKFIAVIMILAVLVVTGCEFLYGLEVYSCNPDNVLGFKAAYIRGEHITFVFDDDYALRNDGEHGHLAWLFNNKDAWSDRDNFYLITDTGGYSVLDSDNFTIDRVNLTISFNKIGTSAKEVRGFGIFTGSFYCRISFDEGVIEEEYQGGEVITYHTQIYDKTESSWSPTETSNEYFPLE